MPLLDKVREELKEKRNHQQSDMHTVHIGIGSHYHLIVAQTLKPVLDVERSLKEIKLLILIAHLLGHAKTVQRLATQREHSLRIHIPTLRNRATRTITLGDEDTRLLLQRAPHVRQVYPTVTQLTIVQVGLLAHLASLLGHTSHLLADTLTLLHLRENHLSHVSILVQEIIHLLLDEIPHKLVDAHPTLRRSRQRAQFHLSLTLKQRLLDIDTDSSHQTIANIPILIVLARIVLDDLSDILLERSLMRTTQRRMLTIDKRIVLLTILLRMRKRNLDILTRQMTNRVESIVVHTIIQEVRQTVARHDTPPPKHNRKPRVEICIIAQHRLDILTPKRIMLEKRRIRLEENIRTILLLRILRHIAHQAPLLKDRTPHLPVTIRMSLKTRAQSIHRFKTHTIQANTLLESLRVILTTRIEHRHRLDKLTQRNTTPIVANRSPEIVLNRHLDTLASIHLKLIDTIVNDLLEQHINTILSLRAVTQTPDIHTRTSAHVLHIRQMPDITLIVVSHSRTLEIQFLHTQSHTHHHQISFLHVLLLFVTLESNDCQILNALVFVSSCGQHSALSNPIRRADSIISAKIRLTQPVS